MIALEHIFQGDGGRFALSVLTPLALVTEPFEMLFYEPSFEFGETLWIWHGLFQYYFCHGNSHWPWTQLDVFGISCLDC